MQPNVAEEVEGKLINVEPDTPASDLLQQQKKERPHKAPSFKPVVDVNSPINFQSDNKSLAGSNDGP